ncbi:MAG: hypothetical protein QOE57_3299, partial [Acidimicrobiaceae bacterium]|nr:hypothetical protein [Acidimicrobiaceae bacterium]
MHASSSVPRTGDSSVSVEAIGDSVDRITAETGFSGVVRIDRDHGVVLAKAYGLAHRGHAVANT